MQLSWNEKFFINFLFHFRNLHYILNILKDKMIVVANVFPKLQTVEILVISLSKKCRFRTRFDSQHVKASQILAKAQWEHFGEAFSSLFWKLIWKMSPLVLGEILGVFVNTLTADGKYPVQGCENLQLPIQMQLSKKPKYFSAFFVPFLDSPGNFEHFEKSMMVLANVLPKVQTVNILVRPLSKKHRFRTRFYSEHVKASLKTCEMSMRAL